MKINFRSNGRATDDTKLAKTQLSGAIYSAKAIA